MWKIEDDPLPFAVWVSEMSALADHCASAPSGDEDRAVRRAFHLYKLSEPALRALADPFLEESAVEQALARDGPQAGIRLIAGARSAFVIAAAEDEGSRVVAEITFDGSQPARAEGNSAAYAMIGAWANYFRSVR